MGRQKKILFICGSMNQTTQMVQIADHLARDHRCYFTPYYSDGFLQMMVRAGLLEFTILGRPSQREASDYLRRRGLEIDPYGSKCFYDAVFTCSDLVIPKNIQSSPIFLVQEGMTDPENLRYHLVRKLRLPRYLANTSMVGLSHAYERFFVASEGFRRHFIRKGVDASKIVVTGIPNFDNAAQYLRNSFPYRDYVLAATSHLRETLKYENRAAFIRRTLEIADGRQVIFKLHPRERHDRARREIERLAPGSMVFSDGNTNHMIANCQALVTRYSSVLLVALALNKKIYSDMNEAELAALRPVQNGGRSAERIAAHCRDYLQGKRADT